MKLIQKCLYYCITVLLYYSMSFTQNVDGKPRVGTHRITSKAQPFLIIKKELFSMKMPQPKKGLSRTENRESSMGIHTDSK